MIKVKTINKILVKEELSYVINLSSKEKEKLIISAYFDFDNQCLVAYNGNDKQFTIPASFFEPNAKEAPDFNQLEIIDHGNTIKFGNYECDARRIVNKK